MSRSDKALAVFKSGLNCCQAVLSVFCSDFGLDTETALKIAAGFGAGMRQGEVCGAVSGAIMAIGLKAGYISGDDNDGKLKTQNIVRDFCSRFREVNDTIICRELLRYDINTPEGKK